MRDRALLLTCFADGLRRSELVALDREAADVGLSRGVALKTCPVRSKEAWLRRAGIQYGPVFPG